MEAEYHRETYRERVGKNKGGQCNKGKEKKQERKAKSM